jgi:acetylornithine deacetylase
MDATDRAIVEAVERASERIVDTLSDLIAFPSVVPEDPKAAGPAERECQEYLRDRLEDLGFTTDLWDPNGPLLYEKYRGRPGAHAGRSFEGRPILAGTLKGAGGGRSIMLTGHIDVVPPGPASHWQSDPFVASVREGRVFGRGAVDMKGGVACMLMAAAVIREIGTQLAGDVVFTTVVDEEIGGMGALAMVDRGYRADAGILPEATALALSPLCHGIVWGRIRIDGIGGHAELKPKSWDRGGPVDAIWLMRQILDGIDILNRRWMNDPRKHHPLMDLPNQVIVTEIRAGEHPSSLAGAAEIVIDAQYLPWEKDERGLGGHVKREIEDHLARICQTDPFLARHPARVEWILDADCAEVPADSPFLAVMEDAARTIGVTPRRWGLGAHSDMGLPTELANTPTINFGPGAPSEAHQPNESVEVTELVAATKMMALAIRRWCS